MYCILHSNEYKKIELIDSVGIYKRFTLDKDRCFCSLSGKKKWNQLFPIGRVCLCVLSDWLMLYAFVLTWLQLECCWDKTFTCGIYCEIHSIYDQPLSMGSWFWYFICLIRLQVVWNWLTRRKHHVNSCKKRPKMLKLMCSCMDRCVMLPREAI